MDLLRICLPKSTVLSITVFYKSNNYLYEIGCSCGTLDCFCRALFILHGLFIHFTTCKGNKNGNKIRGRVFLNTNLFRVIKWHLLCWHVNKLRCTIFFLFFLFTLLVWQLTTKQQQDLVHFRLQHRKSCRSFLFRYNQLSFHN